MRSRERHTGPVWACYRVPLRRGRRGLAVVVLALAGGLAQCSTVDSVTSYAGPVTDPAQLYMALTLDHPAIALSTVAPYDTIRLTATPRDAQGNPMTGLPAPTFTSSDSTAVKVTAEGLVTAVAPATGVYVVATVAAPGPVRHADTAVINVNVVADPPKLASISIHPVLPDSAITAVLVPSVAPCFFSLYLGGLNPVPINFLQPSALDVSGNSVFDLPFRYKALDPAVAALNPSTGLMLIGGKSGQARFVVQTTAYGITKTDTVTYTVTAPICTSFGIYSGGMLEGPPGIYAASKDFTIAHHGIVLWESFTHDAIEVTFDDPTNVVEPPASYCEAVVNSYGGDCGTGNVLIPANSNADPEIIDLSTMRARQFPIPGTYPFHTTTGASGRIVVTP